MTRQVNQNPVCSDCGEMCSHSDPEQVGWITLGGEWLCLKCFSEDEEYHRDKIKPSAEHDREESNHTEDGTFEVNHHTREVTLMGFGTTGIKVPYDQMFALVNGKIGSIQIRGYEIVLAEEMIPVLVMRMLSYRMVWEFPVFAICGAILKDWLEE